MNKIKLELPNGTKLEAIIPSEIDPKIAEVILTSVTGTLAALAKTKDETDLRSFLVRYAAVLVSEAEAVLHSCQMANTVPKAKDKIIEDLLKSLKHKPK